MIRTKVSKSRLHCDVPGAALNAENSQTALMTPVIKKLSLMRARPTKRGHYIQNGKHHDRHFQMELWEYETEESVKEGFMEEVMPE